MLHNRSDCTIKNLRSELKNVSSRLVPSPEATVTSRSPFDSTDLKPTLITIITNSYKKRTGGEIVTDSTHVIQVEQAAGEHPAIPIQRDALRKRN